MRYLVVDTGGWFCGRDALISPQLVSAQPSGAHDPPALRLHEAARGAASGYPAYRAAPYFGSTRPQRRPL